MSKKIIHILFLLIIMICSCGDSSQEGPVGPTIQRLTVSPKSATVSIAGTKTFTAVGGTGSYSWDVSQPTIGSIDSSGVFTPLQSGEATIICTDTRGLTGTSRVTVERSTVTVSPILSTIDYSSSVTFTATGGATSTYFWWVEPPSIYGTITQSGVFTSKSVEGACTITATDGFGNVGSAQLIIRGVPVIISPTSITLSVGNTTSFSATGGDETYTWLSSDTNVGTIGASGTPVTFTAVAAGTTTVTVTDSGGAFASATVTVGTPAGGSAIMIVPGSVSLEKSAAYQFSAYGGTAIYSWSTDDPSVGSINSSGLFTASTSTGTATITVTDSLGDTDTASVTVAASTISISPTSATVAVGSDIIFVGTGGAGTFWWSTTDSSVAIVPAQSSAAATATLTAVDVGTTTLNVIDGNGNVGTAAIIVVAPTAVSISPPSASLAVGTDITFVGTGGAGTYWWSTTNTSVATVPTQTSTQATTTLTAIGAGTTTLNVIDADGSVGTATITVSASAPVTISPASATLAVGSTLVVVGTGGAGTYWWSSSDAVNATVSSQTTTTATTTITTIGAASVTIYAVDVNGNVGTAAITIN